LRTGVDFLVGLCFNTASFNSNIETTDMTYTHFWECKCSPDKPFIHPLSQVGCVLCHATQEGQPRSSQENVDKFGVIPDLSSELFIYCKRFTQSSFGPFVEFTNPDWNKFWKWWEDSRFNAFRAAVLASHQNGSRSREGMDYRVVRCLNHARTPVKWNFTSGSEEYESASGENGGSFVKTYQPIAKIGPCIDIDPQVLLEWDRAAPAES